MRILYPALFVLLILLFVPQQLAGQFYPARTYSTIDGMPSNSVYSITQADNSVMWFLTSQGVTTYDASEWYLFPDSLELPFSKYSYLKKTSDGRIWAAGYNRDSFVIKYYDNQNWYSINLPENWSKKETAFSFEVINDKVFLAKNNKLFIYHSDNKEWKVKEVISSESDNHVSINNLIYLNDELYIATTNGFYNYFDDLVTESDLNKLIGRKRDVLSINTFNNSLYILGFNWIGKVTNSDFTLISDDLGIFSKSIFNKYSLEIDERGRIFYSSYSKAAMLDEETGEFNELQISGRDKNILSNQIFIDKENNIWVGDHRGLFKFNLLRFENYNSNSGLVEDEVSSIIELKDGSILLANPRALNFLKNGSITSIDLRDKYQDIVSRVLDIEETSDSKIFIALSNGGLINITDRESKRIESTSFKNGVISVELFQGKLLVATFDKVYSIDQKGEVSDFSSISGTRNITNLGNGQIALLTHQGVLFTDGKTEQSYQASYASLNNTYDIVYWNDQYLVATNDGVGTLRGDTIIKFAELTTKKRAAYSLLVDSLNNLWIGTSDGVIKWDGKTESSFNTGNGLIGNEINRNALIEDSEHRIWIGTDAGVSVFDEDENLVESHIPNIELNSFQTLQGKDLRSSLEKSIDYSNNSIEVVFRAISFVNEEAINFKYKLEGFDENWINRKDDSNMLLRYTNLRPGSYTFIVQARVESGEWSEPFKVDFEIQKPFYFTYWFLLICILSLIITFYMMYRLRVKFLMDQRVRLKKLVEQRTEEVDMQNSNLREAYRDLKRTQLKLLQTEKMAALGTLTAGVAHEINNPLNYIKAGKEVLKQLSEEDADSIIINDKSGFKRVMEGFDLGVDKILNITKSLGSFSRSENELNRSIYINKILKDTLTILQHELKGRIKVEGNYDSKDVHVIGNESKLYQVFSNILTNSIQAIANEGAITICLTEKRDSVKIEIEDNGEGIPEDIRSKIYDPFFTTKEQGKGSGLGLTIVYNIIEELGGAIEIESSINKGTKVKIELKKSTE